MSIIVSLASSYVVPKISCDSPGSTVTADNISSELAESIELSVESISTTCVKIGTSSLDDCISAAIFPSFITSTALTDATVINDRNKTIEIIKFLLLISFIKFFSSLIS